MKLRTLGGLGLEGSSFGRPKPLLLVVFLALEGPTDRRYLAELFWPTAANPLGSLAKAVSQIRKDVPEAISDDPGQLSTSLDTDAARFLAAVDGGRYEEALSLYAGPFLAGLRLDWGVELEEWVYQKRERFAELARRAMLGLGEWHAARGEFAVGASYGERAYLLRGAPEPEADDFGRIYALLQAGGSAQAAQVRKEAEAFGLSLEVEPASARAALLEAVTKLDVAPPNPYKGLAFFQEEDAPVFFGREAFTAELCEAVGRKPHLVAVVGASGSGKSSVIFAGLLPTLREHEDWLIASCRPGRQPLLSLGLALAPLLEVAEGEVERLAQGSRLAHSMLRRELTLSQVVEGVLHKHPGKRVLLVIDQFEELYTLSEAESIGEGHTARPRPFEPTFYLDELLQALRSREGRFTLLLAVRADFLGAVLQHRPLVELVQRGQHLLGPMSEDELRLAVVEPARQQGVTFEDGLVQRILRDVAGQEGGLPLLEFALTQLWEKQERGRLTHQAYDAIGGVEEALANHAEKVFLELDDNEREAAQVVFLQLVYPRAGQEDTRRVATHEEVGRHWDLVVRLASAPARLLVTGQDEQGRLTVEVAHEALIRRWHTLRQWSAEHRAFRVWQERLRQDVQLWKASGDDEGALLRGFKLDEAKQMLARYRDRLGADERAFIDASQALQAREQVAQRNRKQAQDLARRERERLQRRVAQVLGSALMVALVLSGAALWQWRTATVQRAVAIEERDRAERQARVVLSRQLGAQALAAAQSPGPIEGNYDRALLLAAEAARLDEGSAASYGNLLRVLQAVPTQLGAYLWEPAGPVWSVAFSPDGGMLVSGDDANIVLWRAASWEVVGEPLRGHADGVRSVAFNGDGSLLASASRDRTILLWDVATGQPVGEPLRGHEDEVLSVEFSPDSTMLASASRDGTIALWEVESHSLIGTLVREERFPVASVAFSPDGNLLASGNRDNSVTLWDVTTRTSIGEPLLGHRDQVRAVAFSPDGSLVASGGRDGAVILWDVAAGVTVGEPLRGHQGEVRGVAFNQDGSLLASGASDGAVILWDVARGEARGEPLRGHSDEVRAIAFSPDGRLLASGSNDATVIVWHVERDSALGEPLTGHTGDVWSVAFSPDGSVLATGSQDGTVRLWQVADEVLAQGSPLEFGHPVFSVAFSPDGEELAVSGRSNAVNFWRTNGWERFEATLRGHDGWIRGAAYSPDGSMLATAGHDGALLLWDLNTWSPVAEPLLKHDDQVRALAFEPNGEILTSGGGDGLVILWNVAAQTPIGEPLAGHQDWVDAVSFHPSGELLASGSRDGTVVLWDVRSGEPVGPPLRAHRNWVSSVAFSPDGRVLATASRDGTTILWDVASRMPLGELVAGPRREILDIAYSPDGQLIASGHRDGSATLWTVGPDALLQRACQTAGRDLDDSEWARYLGDLPRQPGCRALEASL